MRSKIVVAALACLLPATALLSIAAGAADVDMAGIVRAIFGGDVTSKAWRIAVYVRIPRMLAAAVSGAALACAGGILQKALMNPLAAPGIIGVNAGAGMGAVIAMLAFPAVTWAIPFMAFAGALCAAAIVYAAARAAGGARGTVILAGAAVSGMVTAGIDAVISIVPDAAADRAAFSMGSFSGATYAQVLRALPFVVIGIVGFFALARQLRILTLGDETARGIGMNAGLMRFVFVMLAALLAGAAVSIAGLIGFVGLIAPHAARMLAGRDDICGRICVPMLGAEVCMICDLIARTAFAPYEISVGIVLSMIGGPFFIYLLFRRRGRGELSDD